MQALRCIRTRQPRSCELLSQLSLLCFCPSRRCQKATPASVQCRVLDRSDKFFTLDLNGRTDTVSIDRLKPAYVDDLATTTSTVDMPLSPTSTVDMPLSPTSPPVTSLPSQPPHGSQSLDPRATRSGRRVHWPAYGFRSLGHWEGSYVVDISVNCNVTPYQLYDIPYQLYLCSSLDLVYHYIFSSGASLRDQVPL